MAGDTHHHGPLAGASAGAVAVLTGGGLVLIAARRQLGEVATVTAWALMTVVVGTVLAATVYGVLWLRHRIQHPETLAGRQVIRAAVVDQAPVPQAIEAPAEQPAAIEPPRSNDLHLHFHGMTPAEAAEAIRQASEGR